jgi:hypothetical protein
MTTPTELLDKHIDFRREFGKNVCQRISEAIVKLEFEQTISLTFPDYEKVDFYLITDPFTQKQNLAGYWFGSNGRRIGQIQFNSDGSVYAEFDILQPHPTKSNLFVEAVNVWGQEATMKVDVKLLEMPT